MTRLAGLIGLLALGACSQGGDWVHPTAGPAEAQQMGARCQYEAAAHSRPLAYTAAAAFDSGFQGARLMGLCMQAAGFVRGGALPAKPGGPLQAGDMGESRPNAPSTEELERRTAAMRAS